MTQSAFNAARRYYENLAEQNPDQYVRVFFNQKSGAGTSFCLNSKDHIEYYVGGGLVRIDQPSIPTYYFVEVEDIESVSVSFIKKR